MITLNIISPSACISSGKRYLEYLYLFDGTEVQTYPLILTSLVVDSHVRGGWSAIVPAGHYSQAGVGVEEGCINIMTIDLTFERDTELTFSVEVKRPSFLVGGDTPMARMLVGGEPCTMRVDGVAVTWTRVGHQLTLPVSNGVLLTADKIYVGNVPETPITVEITDNFATVTSRPLNVDYYAVAGGAPLETTLFESIASDGTTYHFSPNTVESDKGSWSAYGLVAVDFVDSRPYGVTESAIIDFWLGTTYVVPLIDFRIFRAVKVRGKVRFYILRADGVYVYDDKGMELFVGLGDYDKLVVGAEFFLAHRGNQIVFRNADFETINNPFIHALCGNNAPLEGITNGSFYYFFPADGHGGRLDFTHLLTTEILSDARLGSATDGFTISYPIGEVLYLRDVNSGAITTYALNLGLIERTAVTKCGVYVYAVDGEAWILPKQYCLYAPSNVAQLATSKDIVLDLEVA